MLHCLPHFCRALGAVSDAAHASMMSKLLDQYEQKDNLAQQLEAITKLEVCVCVGGVPRPVVLLVLHLYPPGLLCACTHVAGLAQVCAHALCMVSRRLPLVCCAMSLHPVQTELCGSQPVKACKLH